MFFSEQHDREFRNALCLDQGEDFKEFIKRSEPSRHKHKSKAVFHETDFSGKEIVKVNGNIGVAIPLLLMRQLDIKANRFAFREGGSFVGSFHKARPAAGDNRKIMLRQSVR